jgi:acetyl-CoA decarbonylase/synthase complex subunit gamma
MREKTFTTVERLVLVPVELVHALKTLLMIGPILLVLGGLAGKGGFFAGAVGLGLLDTAGLAIGIFSGCVLTPLLLPWLPGRAFAAKGVLPGIAGALLFWFFLSADRTGSTLGPFDAAAWMFIIPAVSAYLAMNFTGCSTFTSLSGVKREMRLAVPLEIGAFAAGIILLAVSRFLS